MVELIFKPDFILSLGRTAWDQDSSLRRSGSVGLYSLLLYVLTTPSRSHFGEISVLRGGSPCWLLSCLDKHHDQKQLGGERVDLALLVLVTVHRGGESSQKPKQEQRQEPWRKLRVGFFRTHIHVLLLHVLGPPAQGGNITKEGR